MEIERISTDLVGFVSWNNNKLSYENDFGIHRGFGVVYSAPARMLSCSIPCHVGDILKDLCKTCEDVVT